MAEAVLQVHAAGPLVSVQDGGRQGLMRFGVPASGAMDRLSFAAANIALGNQAGTAGIEVSLGGLMLDCLQGEIGFAVAGGGFVVEHAGQKQTSWMMATLRTGQRLTVRPGYWGSWCYLAFAGQMQGKDWLGSVATHSQSGLGGGMLTAGRQIRIADTRIAPEASFARPVSARPRDLLHVTLGPQDRLFAPEIVRAFLAGYWRTTDAGDRMGIRLAGPPIAPTAALDIPSEPVARGSVQVAGDGVPLILLADHQTTGGYPKIATVLDCDLDAFVQLRPHSLLRFCAVTPEKAIQIARTRALVNTRYLSALSLASRLRLRSTPQR